MYLLKNHRYIFIISITIFFSGCIVEPPLNVEEQFAENPANDLFAYIASEGYFHEVGGRPPYISAYEIFARPADYVILDLRSEEEFAEGHITDAINISTSSIITTINSNPDSTENSFVLVCKNGQLSSYVNCLLGIYGIEKVSTLRYGMASWNIQFSTEWNNNLAWFYKDDNHPLDDYIAPLHETKPLPQISEIEGNTIKEKVQLRVEYLLQSIPDINGTLEEQTTLFTSFENIYQNYNGNAFVGLSIVCYGDINLYRLYGKTGHPSNPSHPPGTLWYGMPIVLNPSSQFYLQTLPQNEPLVIYSSNGHDSAFLMGFLRFLGYDAKSMLYGVNAFGYNRMLNHEDPFVVNDAFTSADILNLPYEIGTDPLKSP